MAEEPDYRALYEQERRGREEERRGRLQAEIEAQRARETQRQTARFNELLRQELLQQRDQNNRAFMSSSFSSLLSRLSLPLIL